MKFKGPGLRYEIAVSVQTGHIVSVIGPYPCGSWRDDKIFMNGLVHRLLPGEKVIADKGYRMLGRWCECPDRINGNVNYERLKYNVRSRHETVNARFKHYCALSSRFRGHPSEHWYHVHAIANIVQINLHNGKPLFQLPEYNDRDYL